MWFMAATTSLGLAAGCAMLGGAALLTTLHEPPNRMGPEAELSADLQEPEAKHPPTEQGLPEPQAGLQQAAPQVPADAEASKGVEPAVEIGSERSPAPAPVTRPSVQPKPPQETQPAPEADETVYVEIWVSSVPMGMPITMDGTERGHTPLTMELEQGPHVASITTATGAHALMLNVGPDQPTRHIWRERDQKWVQTD